MNKSDEDTPVETWRIPLWYERATAWTWRGLILVAGLYVVGRVFGALRMVIVPVMVAILLAALASPVVARLRQWGLPPFAAAATGFLGMVGIASAIVGIAAALVGTELADGANWAIVYQDVQTWLVDGPVALTQAQVDGYESRVRSSFAGGIGSVGVDRAQLMVQLLGAVVLTLVLFFIFIKDGASMWSWFVARVKPHRKDVIDDAGRRAFAALSSYMRGVFFAGAIDGAAIGIALRVIGVPLAVPLGLLTVFAGFFPIVGAVVAGAVAVLVALVFNGPGDALIVFVVALIVQQAEGNLVLPIILRKQLNLHPAVVLIALAAGGSMAGIAGAFIAVPVAAAISAAASTVSSHNVAQQRA